MSRHEETGQVLVMAALMMTVTLGFLGLVLDSSRMTVERRRLQNGVDAAALAGIQVLPSSTSNATTAANSWATSNGLKAGEVTQVAFTATSTANDTITVKASRTVPYTFTKVLGKNSGAVEVQAKAYVGSVTGGTGVMPFGIVDLNGATAGFGYSFGQSVTIKEVPGNSFGPGNYGFLALDGNGANQLRTTLSNGGSSTSYSVGDKVNTKPGQNTGPVTQGLDTWAANNGDSMNSSCNTYATNVTVVNGRAQISSKCKYRVVLIPIIDQWPNGNKPVTILGFAQMYLTGWDANNGKAITGVFLDTVMPSKTGTTIGAANSYGTRVTKLSQ